MSARRPSRRSLFAAAASALVLLLFAAWPWRAAGVRASDADVVTLASGSAVHLATPPFLKVGGRYAFTWPGGGPPQTFVVKEKRDDGWILVEVADETIKPELYVPGEFPTRWLHVGLAVSIQEMRPLP